MSDKQKENAVAEESLTFYRGIDFANREVRTGRCFVQDDGVILTVSLQQASENQIKCTGVDCPFGTSAEFYQLLIGKLPDATDDGSLEARATERWARRVISKEYQTQQLWDEKARLEFGRDCYFHPTRHIQPSVGLRIVPSCLNWIVREAPLTGTPNVKLKAARGGKGTVVEAHPRLFLYSMIERIQRNNPGAVNTNLLNQVASYKDNKKKSHQKQREAVYTFLRDHPEWCGRARRRLEPGDPDPELLLSDHAFDAWLSALTAWATVQGETIQWKKTGGMKIRKSRMEIEGHFLILDHAR